jgi:hypothetical protein
MIISRLSLQRHLYEHVFKYKELWASKKPLTLVADDRKPAILNGQILATHPSDVVGLLLAFPIRDFSEH